MNIRKLFCDPPRTIEVNANQKIFVGKGLVTGVSLSAGAAAAAAVLYDGTDAAGTRKQTVTAAVNVTLSPYIPKGILFEHGLFVTVSVATAFLSVSFYSIGEDVPSAKEKA